MNTKKASNLVDALNIFDPELALSTREEMAAYFIAREDSPLQELETLLRFAKRRPKILFTGHRGSGKSTELAQLRLLLEDEFQVVNFSVKRSINLFDIQYTDVLLALAIELFKSATDQKLKVAESLMKDIYLWFKKDISSEVTTDETDQANIAASLNAYVFKLESKLGTESSTRKIIREKIEPRLAQLLERVNLIVGEVESQSNKKVLIIIEDLDKADLANAKEIFCGHSMSLTQPDCSIIYTFPIALRHDNDFINICLNFDEPSVLPIFKIQTHTGARDENGIRELQRIILSRIESRLISPAAIERITLLSGGLPRELVTLARRACLIAIRRDATEISEEIVLEAANRHRNDYRVLLTRQQVELLKQVQSEKSMENDESHRALLHNLSVLEYRNHHIWYDVHPIVRELLAE
jgi:hypothetical protein